MGKVGQKYRGQNRSTRSYQCSTRTPPFKTAGPGGIRPGGLPRRFELLTKLAAILDLGAQSRLTRTPLPGQVKLPFQLPGRPICLKSTWGVERTVYTRWTQVAPGGFFRAPTGGVALAKKVERAVKMGTCSLQSPPLIS